LTKDAGRVKTSLEHHSPEAAYAIFEEIITPKVIGKKPDEAVKHICQDLLSRMAIKKASFPESTGSLTLTRITQAMMDIRGFDPSGWARATMLLLQHICQTSTAPGDYGSIESYDYAMAQRDSTLRDILGAWALVSKQAIFRNTDTKANNDGSDAVAQSSAQSPSPANPRPPKRQQFKVQSGLRGAIGDMFPQYAEASVVLSWVLFATHTLVTDPTNYNRTTKEEAAPFLKIANHLLSTGGRPGLNSYEFALRQYPDLRNYLQQRRESEGGAMGNISRKGHAIHNTNKKVKADVVHRKIGQAYKTRNLKLLKEVWADYWGDSPAPPSAEVQEELRKSPELFDYFVLAFMALRQPNIAITVWDSMTQIGVQPTIKTWTSMMLGCTKANNPAGIKLVWERLIASGTKLDTAVWTARISGLVSSGDPDAGIQALNEMASIWRERGQPENALIAVKPTVEPVNAIVAGLIRLNRQPDVYSVLAWASRQGIDPDVYTFNTLLRPLVREGQTEEVNKIFKMMEELKIEPDSATFTILMDGALSDVGTLSPEEQTAAVNRIIAKMQATGVRINMQMYAKIIYILLQEGNNAAEPVKAVLAHIWGNGQELSSSIYTMLAEHYFSQDPPNPDAVTALIESRRLHSQPSIDRVFWERVIKGYCQVGDVDRALGHFERVSNSGGIIIFSTLHVLLETLLQMGRVEEARSVVDKALRIREAMADGQTEEEEQQQQLLRYANRREARADEARRPNRFWKHRFWHLAYRNGLIDDDAMAKMEAALGPAVF